MWSRWAAFFLSLAGLAVSVYLTVEHYTTGSVLACPQTGVIDCEKVTTSPQSVWLGVPLSVWGLVYFVAAVGATAPPTWRKGSAVADRVRLGMAAVGVLSVIYLIYVELFVVDAICLWCTAVHVLTIALFAVVVVGIAARPVAPVRGKPRR
jgi:uncharacterized membrane protein